MVFWGKKAINNNVLALFLIFIIFLVLFSTFKILNYYNVNVYTANAVANVSFCFNYPPTPVFDNCSNTTYVLQEYNCFVNTSDYFENQSHLFSDNTNLFDINSSTGEIKFTPQIGDEGNYLINITVVDDSGCSVNFDSGILNLTILPKQNNETLVIFDDSDLNITIYKFQPIMFYANYTDDNNTITNASCNISFNTNGFFSQYYNMTFDNNSGLYFYNYTTGFLQGEHLFKVRCRNLDENYSSIENTSTFYITNRPPYLYHVFPNITMRQGSSVTGYNLNDYFKDPDLDVLYFTHSNPSYINIIISNDGTVTIIPEPWYSGTKTVFFYANDTYSSLVPSNAFNITVKPITVSPPDTSSSGGGGGGSPSIICIENWYCYDWGECLPTGIQTRQCIDLTGCNTTRNKPEVVRNCTYIGTCYDNIKNCHDNLCEEGVDCGGPCNPCPSCFDGIKNQNEEGIDCGGPCDPCQKNITKPIKINYTSKPENKKDNFDFTLIGIFLSAFILALISALLHDKLTPILSKLLFIVPAKKKVSLTLEANTIILLELLLKDFSEGRINYNDTVDKAFYLLQELLKKEFSFKEEKTLEELKKYNKKLGKKYGRILDSIIKDLEVASFTNKKVDLKKTINNILKLTYYFMTTQKYYDNLNRILDYSEKEKSLLLEKILTSIELLYSNKRLESSKNLFKEAKFYYKYLKSKKDKNKFREKMLFFEEKFKN